MHLSALILALTTIGLTSALPTANPTPSNKDGCPLPPSPPETTNKIHPTTTSQYDVWTGAVRHKSPKGKISKTGKTTDITTLLTFTFPAESKNKICTFHFDLSSDPSAKVSGTGGFDLFLSLAPATKSSESWPSGNLRDQHFGRMVAEPMSDVVFGKTFPCPAGKTYGGELVGYGDVDLVEWRAGEAGPYITY